MKYVFLASTLALTVYGQLIIKARADLYSAAAPGRAQYLFGMMTDLYVFSGLAGAVLAALAWMLAVQDLQLAYAYPFMALSFVFVPVLASVLLGEAVGLAQIVGCLLIVLGVSISTAFR